MSRNTVLAAFIVLATAAPSFAEQATPEMRTNEAATEAQFNERSSAMQLALKEAARLTKGQGTAPQAGCDAQGKSEFKDGCRLVWLDENGTRQLAWVRGVWANGPDMRPATLGVDGRIY